jgi:glucans biosynthesis protein
MNRDPAQQADIERRLSNLAKAPRCGARTRAGHPCKQAAVTGRARCRMHGGARGSGGPCGDRNGNFKYGLWTVENVEMRKAVRLKIRGTRALLQELKSARVDPEAQRKAVPTTFSRAPSSTRGRRPLRRSGSAVGGSPVGMLPPRREIGTARVQAREPTVAVRPDAWGRVAISDHPPPGFGEIAMTNGS